MTTTALPLSRRATGRLRLHAASGLALARRHRDLWPAAAIVVAVVAAYHLTFASLIDYLRLETPLAYLPLLPLFALGTALITARRYRDAPRPIQDRQIDVLIAVPLLIVALLLITIVPALASTYYWTNRPDVLSLAIFTAALVILAYGVTWFWRIRWSLVFLVLMWPALYLHVMGGLMLSFTDATNGALASLVQHLPLGVSLSGTPGTVDLHPAGQGPMQVSIGSACSGADSMLGFLLIGSALLTTQRGGLMRKLLWLAAGLTLTFPLNLVRLTSILGIAASGHPGFALGPYHAVIGLILFALLVLLMMLLLPRFGLSSKPPVTAARQAGAQPVKRRSRRRAAIALTGLAGLALVAGLADHALAPYAAFEDGFGSPRVLPFASGAAPAGWAIYHEADYPWAQQYFGANSSFSRFTVIDGGGEMVFADVVRTDDRGALDAYNLQNCFLFHDYSIVTSRRVDLGGGVTGLLLNYADPRSHAQWATVSWAWPVNVNGETWYERIALTSSLVTGGSDADVQPSGGIGDFWISLLNMLNGGYSSATADSTYHQADTSLQAEAHTLISGTVSRSG